MKLDGSWKKCRSHFLMQVQCYRDNLVHILGNLTSESTLSYVLRQDTPVDRFECFSTYNEIIAFRDVISYIIHVVHVSHISLISRPEACKEPFQAFNMAHAYCRLHARSIFESLKENRIQRMPNINPLVPNPRLGYLILGDVFNLHHPLCTRAGMSVAQNAWTRLESLGTMLCHNSTLYKRTVPSNNSNEK